jgi:hypothetical protein
VAAGSVVILELMSFHSGRGDLTYLYNCVTVDGKIYFTACNYIEGNIQNNKVAFKHATHHANVANEIKGPLGETSHPVRSN